MKKLVLAITLSTIAIMPAMAKQESTAPLDDAQKIFNMDSNPLELARLSQTEMEETEGAFFPVPIIGAIAGGTGYL
ncbi:hypothetical protein QN374_16225, partial [Herbaspirillum sp. RTI4]